MPGVLDGPGVHDHHADSARAVQLQRNLGGMIACCNMNGDLWYCPDCGEWMRNSIAECRCPDGIVQDADMTTEGRALIYWLNETIEGVR